jgi:urease accessory protein
VTLVGVRAAGHRAALRLTPGLLSPRLITGDANGAKVALVATTALLLGGDQVDLELDIGPGAWLEIVETAGTVAYDAAGEPSGWSVRVTVAAGGLLIWHGEPFVVASGANVLRRSHFSLADDASVCVRETVVLGRGGERGGAVRIENRVCQGDLPVLVEHLDLRDRSIRELPGVIGPAAVVDTVMMLGGVAPAQPPPETGTVFALAESAGTVGRVLRAGLAGSPVAGWWPAWSRVARERYVASLG